MERSKQRAEYFVEEARSLREQNNRLDKALFMIKLAFDNMASTAGSNGQDRSEEALRRLHGPDAECYVVI